MRVFRSGARVVRVSPVLAYYRSHPGSMSTDARMMLDASLHVLDRAYGPDPRVVTADPRYVAGAPRELRPAAVFRHLCWWGSAALAAGGDGLGLVDAVADDITALDDVSELAAIAAFALRRVVCDQDAWDRLGHVVRAFLDRLERVTGVEGLLWRTLLLTASADVAIDLPVRLSDVQAATIELTEPIADIDVTDGVSRVLVVGRVNGQPVGAIELLVPDGRVSRDALIDSMVDAWSWELCVAHIQGRGTVPPGADPDQLWAALVDDLWLDDPPPRPRHVLAGPRPVAIVAGEPLPRVLGVGAVSARVRVGTTELGAVRVAPADARNRRRLAVALTVAHGARLFEVVAREVLVGARGGETSLASMIARVDATRRAAEG
jgi:hypothetical protein